ncbi:MAG: hypothetical protein AB1679_18695 [Actinomycetota bacterium]
MMIEVSEFRRGRAVIHLGDRVRVRPTPGRRNGFEAVVQRIRIDEATGLVREVDVFGGARGRAMFRTFRPERIERLARHRQAGTGRGRTNGQAAS